MIIGIGIDLTAVGRTRELVQRFGGRFTARVFSEAERSYCDRRKDPAQSYAARFAAKEAVMKALASGWGSGVRFKEIEVMSEGAGGPEIRLHGGAAARAESLGAETVFVSMAHEGDVAIAQAVVTGQGISRGRMT